MRIVHTEGFRVDLGAHVFPTAKYGLVRGELLASGAVSEARFVSPAPASWDDLALVHSDDWLTKVRLHTLTLEEMFRLELPSTPAVVEGFRLMCGGTIAALGYALADGIAVTLGGGLHHAHAGHGEGFCLFNDVAVAIRVAQRDGRIRRAAVVDLDVHHGNGTAAIFAGDPDVFTFSMHQWNNYPAEKPPSTLDVHLPDGTPDGRYLAELRGALPLVLAHEPDVICYLAGADPYRDDQLGGLRLSRDGLRARDRFVFESASRSRIPVVVTLAGGYARNTADTVAIHVATIEEALAVFGPGDPPAR
jgi:acetoin utilization deacetylase AcuC-like enzyme